ncbi:hypothetical protein AC579_4132 [Pseudocercospora musae]|uniref:ATP-dependent DNA helicase PIF1 n=1 Tax=Pseudocercospora musae TaxID=113226 RepID=A0A139IDY3_9PEZI|nr:hypothetical protein AC579_4132 [Pseudocercospora musae]
MNTIEHSLGLLLCLTTLYVLHWMLLGRTAGVRSRLPAIPRWCRAPASAFATSTASHRAFPLSLPILSTRPLEESAAVVSMLRGAVQEHERKTAQSSSQKAAFTTTNPGYKNPLKPSSASALNALNNYPSRHSTGVKRSASGLAKSLDGSFDDDVASRYQPIVVGGSASPTQRSIPNFPHENLFDADEFDDDIELDIDAPLPKPTVTSPKLPPQPTHSTSKSTVSYPTLPKQPQQPQTWAQQSNEEDLVDFTQPATRDLAPNSSAPLPWSSSPLEHFHPPPQSKPLLSLQDYAFDGRVGKGASTQQRPAKRRRLPWRDQQGSQNDAASTQPTSSTTSKLKNTYATPASTKDKSHKSIYPWNTTASAVKEQQKKHREEAKKLSLKKVDGTEDSVRKAKSTQKRPARVFLSDEQRHVLELVIEKKKSVFFTGSAGTGKSVLMREIISQLRKKYQREPDRVAVTASTGLAACNVGGVTLHSFAGIGLGKEDVPELVRKIKRNQKAKHRWMRTKVLVIDEVSMVDGELFDKLEAIARQIRNNGRPFGGIQLVITGDFFQLPPVPEGGRAAKFCFDGATWSTCIEHTIGLHHVFRQKDPIFAGMLNEMREGRLTESSIQAFRKLDRPLNFEDSLDATELFPTRQEVDRANTGRLSLLQGELYPFPAKDGGSIVDKAQRDKLLSNCLAPEMITLKKGAQVMLIKNIDETLVNGSLGRIIGFMDERQFDSYNNNEAAFLQSPGGTIQSNRDVDESQPDARQMMQGITTSRRWPLARFAVADGTWRDLLCQPETWNVELPNGEIQASRAQIPLILAWALSIHKAQGQTLDRVKVDLGKVFEKGQAYVALSRATSMAGLQVLRFDPRKVNAHERVRNFYSKLARVELAEKNQARLEKIKEPSKTTTSAKDYEEQFMTGARMVEGNFNWEDF